MQCPVDAATLLMSVREGVEIDYCPQCRGIWLDRGELDKLIERSDRDDDDDDRRDRSSGRDRPPSPSYDDRRNQPPRKKKKWLSDMFEFD